MTTSSPPRIAIFTHDTFGLGHVRRCLHFVRAMAEEAPDASILLITGSPAFPAMSGLPANADIVKIPTIARTGRKEDRPPHLPLPVADLSRIRAGIIRETVAAFDPHVFLVDNFPLGSRGELRPTLEALGSTHTQTVLGLRDILGKSERVREDWQRGDVYDVLERHYDQIFVYGSGDVMDVADAYALPPSVAAKVRYCGYVTEETEALLTPDEVGAELGIDGPFVLATGGGGGDAFPLMDTFVDALEQLPPLPAVLVTGPLMSRELRAQLEQRAPRDRPVRVIDYTPHLRSYMKTAAAVVSMCGYNTAIELVATGARAVVVPRTWRYGEQMRGTEAGVEWEQLLRARALAEHGVVQLLEPEDLDPGRLAERIQHVIAAPSRTADSSPRAVDLGGRRTVARHLLALSRSPRTTERSLVPA